MKWLTYAHGVLKTPAITRSVELLDKYFENEPSIITSGLRSSTKQLSIIIDKAIRHKIDKEFPEFALYQSHGPDVQDVIDEKLLYFWQRTWSRLLELGDIVNPPLPAEALFDYVRPGSVENKKGLIIQISPHQRGLAFDVGGGTNLAEKEKRIIKAMGSGECFIKSYLMEKVNNAVHVDCLQIG